jgi:hypothetical protein
MVRRASLRAAHLSLRATASDRAATLWRFAGILASVEARFPLSRNEIAKVRIRREPVRPEMFAPSPTQPCSKIAGEQPQD